MNEVLPVERIKKHLEEFDRQKSKMSEFIKQHFTGLNDNEQKILMTFLFRCRPIGHISPQTDLESTFTDLIMVIRKIIEVIQNQDEKS